VEASILIGRRAELKVTDTPGSPKLYSRLACAIEQTRSGFDWATSSGTSTRWDWMAVVALDEPWEGTDHRFAILVPRDPRARLPVRFLRRVHVEVAPASSVQTAFNTDRSGVRALALLRLLG
jgi:hypothetical protein